MSETFIKIDSLQHREISRRISLRTDQTEPNPLCRFAKQQVYCNEISLIQSFLLSGNLQ